MKYPNGGNRRNGEPRQSATREQFWKQRGESHLLDRLLDVDRAQEAVVEDVEGHLEASQKGLGVVVGVLCIAFVAWHGKNVLVRMEYGIDALNFSGIRTRASPCRK